MMLTSQQHILREEQSHPHRKPGWTSEDRGGGLMGERNKHKLGMHAEGEVCPFLLRPILCALVWIHGSVFNVNLSEPFKNTHFSSP